MKKFLLALFCVLLSTTSILAQGGSVSGTVVDENGEPVIGASVMIKGTSTGTVTDIDGKFSLNAAGKTLVISYIGYDKKEIVLTIPRFAGTAIAVAEAASIIHVNNIFFIFCIVFNRKANKYTKK